MSGKPFWKRVPPAGPFLSLLLIGMVLLSARLYYRAITVQRFLEPALALAQPRNEFAKNISARFQKEFGAGPVRGFKVGSSSILIDASVMFNRDGSLKPTAGDDLRRLARIFLALFQDRHTRSEINIVLILGRYPSFGVSQATAFERLRVQRLTGLIQDALFAVEPELGKNYESLFAATAAPAGPYSPVSPVVEFRIVPSEYLHIEVLEKLQKYFE